MVYFAGAGLMICTLTLPVLAPFGAPWRNHFGTLTFVCFVICVVLVKMTAFKVETARAQGRPVPRHAHFCAVLAAAAMAGAACFMYWKKSSATDPWMVILVALFLCWLGRDYLRRWTRGAP
jgi:hypothetical protein